MRGLLLLVAAFALGCGGGSTTVTGTVTFEGKKVVYGTVALTGSDGVTKYGKIEPDGTFTIHDVRIGSNKVFVSSPTPPGVQKAATAPTPENRDEEFAARGRMPANTPINQDVVKNWFPLPEKFGDPNLADLVVEIESGKTLVIDLK